MAELLLVEAVNDALHVEMERDASVMVMGEDVGKLGGVFRATAGLQERFGVDRCVDTPLAEAGILGTAVGLCMAGWRPVGRDAVRRLQLSGARSADQPRRSLSLADARGDVVPAHDPHAVRRRSARARAARRLAGDVLRPHAWGEGRDPVQSGRREGAPRGGDPRSGSSRRPRAEAPLPHGQGGRSRGRAHRSARRIADRA